MTAKVYHKLTNIDEISLEAACSECGLTGINRKGVSYGKQRYRCKAAAFITNSRIPQAKQVNRKWYRLKGIRCEICGDTEKLVIDHDHQLNVYRGTLCHCCNIGIGMFRENTWKLHQAVKYLEAWKSKYP